MSAKIQVIRLDNVIVVTSQFFCYHCIEHIELHTCTKFHDHWSNDNKSYDGGASCLPPPPPPKTDGSKKPTSNRVKQEEKER